MNFSKKDFAYSVITGFYAGLIAWRIFEFLKLDIFEKLFSIVGMTNTHVSSAWLMVLIPIVWIVGVNFGYFLGRWMPFFNQFGKFVAVGFTNFVVYTGILNIFIAYFNVTSGPWFSIFVAVAFMAGALHSYGWNKSWVFSGGNNNAGGEFVKFFLVNGIAGLINVGVASLLVNAVHPMFGITPEGWANVGGIIGSAAALIFSFVGFRLLVFKK